MTVTSKAPVRCESDSADPELDALRQFDTCTLSNAIETFGIRTANEGFADSSIRSIVAGRQLMLGYAATARLKSSAAPVKGQRFCDRAGWWEYVLSIPPPRVVVVQDICNRPGFGAFLGEVHSAILMRLGCVGAVTNGAVRDLPAVEAMGFALFAGNVAVSHCYAHLVDFGTPVEIGGMQVVSGDLISGDRHGVLSIPKPIVPRLPAAAARLVEKERRIIDFCRSGEFSVGRLRALVCGND